MVAWTGMGVNTTKSWASILAQDTGIKIRVAPESDTVNRFRWIKLGLFQLTGGNNSETSQMLMADRRYAVRDGGPFQVRAVWSHSKANAGFFVRGDSHIRTPLDIKPGDKIIYMTIAPAGLTTMQALVAWSGVDPDDLVFVPAGSMDANTRFLIEGKGDVAFGFPISPIWYESEAAPQGQRWVELDPEKEPEGAARYREVSPTVTFATMSGTIVPSAI